jgi:hypothetical protein
VFATNSYSQMEFSSAKFKAIPPLDTGIKTKKSNSSNSCPARYFSSNILKKMKKFQSTNFKIGDPDPFSMIQTNDFINPGDEVEIK